MSVPMPRVGRQRGPLSGRASRGLLCLLRRFVAQIGLLGLLGLLSVAHAQAPQDCRAESLSPTVTRAVADAYVEDVLDRKAFRRGELSAEELHARDERRVRLAECLYLLGQHFTTADLTHLMWIHHHHASRESKFKALAFAALLASNAPESQKDFELALDRLLIELGRPQVYGTQHPAMAGSQPENRVNSKN